MAHRTRRSESGEGSEVDGYQQLELDRSRNDQKLKTRFEHIFRKYEHDFTGVGDEIDIESGDVVVDNGHLQYMRHEVDPGKSASSRFVRTFQEKLEHEDESTSSEGEDEGDESSEEETDGDSVEDGKTPGMRHRTDGHHRLNPEAAINSFRDLARPAPRLAHLLVGEGTREQPLDLLHEDESLDESIDESASESVGPANMLGQLPAVRDSAILRQPRDERKAIDADTIQALGTSIANQLAQLMAGPSKKKSKRPRSRHEHRSRESAWNYPEIPKSSRRKRQRSPSLGEQPPTSPPGGSPGNDSLWAVESTSIRGRKRRRLDLGDRSLGATPVSNNTRTSLLPSSGRGDARRCWNCSLTGSSAWQKGPHGQDLCASCWKYYEYNGRMKPFDSPTPSVEEQESSYENEAEDDSVPFEEPAFEVRSDVSETHRSDQRSLNGSFTSGDLARAGHALKTVISGASRTPQDYLIEYSPPADPQEPTPSELSPGKQPEYLANTSRTLADTSSPKQRFEYTVEEDALVIQLKEVKKLSWRDVCRLMPIRTPASVQSRYSRELQGKDCAGRRLLLAQAQLQPAMTSAPTSDSPSPFQWDANTDELVLELYDNKNLQWNEIADLLPGRTAESVKERHEFLAKRKAQNIPPLVFTTTITPDQYGSELMPWQTLNRFSAEEDALMVRLREHDSLEWAEVVKSFPTRTQASLQGRYSRWLAPGKRKEMHTNKSDRVQGTVEEALLAVDPELVAGGTKFTAEEDRLIQRLREGDHLDWQEIAARLLNRTARAVENRYAYKFSSADIKKESVSPKRGASSDSLTWPHAQPATERDLALFGGGDANAPRLQQSTALRSLGPGYRTPFTKDEDLLILRMKEADDQSWDEIARRMPGRSVKSISERYWEHLLPKSRSSRPDGRAFDPLIQDDNASETVSQKDGQVLRHTPRQSLPSKLPSAQGRNGTPMLRKALGNSIRRRSDDFFPRVAPDSSAKALPSTTTASEPGLVNRECDVEAGLAQPDANHEENALDTTSDARDSSMFEKLMQVATKLSIQQKNSTLFLRVREIYDKDPRDPRLSRLLDAFADTSVTANELLHILDDIATGAASAIDANDLRVDTDFPPQPELSAATRPTTPDTSTSQILLSPSTLPTSAHDDEDVEHPSISQSPIPAILKGQNESPSTVAAKRAVTTRLRRTRSVTSQSAVDDSAARDATDQPTQSERQDLITSEPTKWTVFAVVKSVFESHASQPLDCKEIFRRIEKNFASYCRSKPAWKASVRAELSRQPCFQRALLQTGGNAWQLTTKSHDAGGEVQNPSDMRDNKGASAGAVADDDGDTITVSTAPKRPGLRTGSANQSIEQDPVPAEPSLGNTEPQHSKGSKRPITATRPTRLSAAADVPSEEIEIPDSEDEAMELTVMENDSDDEITFASSPPTAMKTQPRKLPAFRRNTDGSPTRPQRRRIKKSAMQSSVSMPAAASASSSSPAFVKPTTPASIYKATATPKSMPLRSKQKLPIIRKKVSFAKTPSSKTLETAKRVVETPAREFGSDEDELA